MFKSIVRILAVLGALFLIGLALAVAVLINSKGTVPSKTILEANFEETLLENIPDTPTARLMTKEKQTMRDVIDAIDRGAGRRSGGWADCKDRRRAFGHGANPGNSRRSFAISIA
jgi:hypothetical protein